MPTTTSITTAGAGLTSGAATPSLRAATPADVAAVERLLTEAGLPTAGVAEILAERPADFVVADDPERPGEIAAVAGLEVCCDERSDIPATALLRSVAVRPGGAGTGSGTPWCGGSCARRRAGVYARFTSSR